MISISNFISDQLSTIPIRKITKIYNLFEPNKKLIKYDNLESKIKNKNIITCIGALEKIKGVELLIQAFSDVRNNKDWLLLIVGDGSQKEYLESLSKKLNIQDKIIFTGNIEHKFIPYIYHISDIIALLSLWPEPFSRIILISPERFPSAALCNRVPPSFLFD